MTSRQRVISLACWAMTLFIAAAACGRTSDPLPSWNNVASKQAILAFVEKVTAEGGPDYVPPAERIATFDNDGTLWCEQPMYVQLVFALDRIKALAPQHPEWKTSEPFKSLLAGDRKALAQIGSETVAVDLMMATHAGMSTADFEMIVRDWISTAKHPRFDRLYTRLAYQPMLEVIEYLGRSEFKIFIVSGGGIEFMRPWTPRVYGIPPERVVGSGIKVKYEVKDGAPVLMRLPAVDFIDDKAGKPVGINRFIGRRPIIAFGNSDGDFEMLQYTTMSEPGRSRPRLGLIVHHTDAEREYVYDRDSAVGRLDKALDEAPQRGWVLIDMKRDWRKIFPE